MIQEVIQETVKRSALVLCALALMLHISMGTVLAAQTASGSREAARQQFVELLRYMEIDHKVSPAQLDKLVELKLQVEQPGQTAQQLQAAFQEIRTIFAELIGMDAQTFMPFIRFFAGNDAGRMQAGGRFDLSPPSPRSDDTGGSLHVVTRGHGPVPLVLISALGLEGATLYESFMERNPDRYTMYAVTLPGFGRAPAPKWPAVRDFTRRPWLNTAEQALARFLDERNLEDVVVVGTAAGGYFAARLALDHPEKVRAAVIVSGLVNAPVSRLSHPNRPATYEERQIFANQAFPFQLTPAVEVPPFEELVEKIGSATGSNPTPLFANAMVSNLKDTELQRVWTALTYQNTGLHGGFRYGNELGTTDLTPDLARLAVPLLVAAPRVDDPVGGPTAFVGEYQWEKIKLLYPSIPLTVVPFEETRAYIMQDNPVAFDRVLADFLAGRPPHFTQRERVPGPRPSPWAGVMQEFGPVRISMTYGRPSVRSRAIWGKLVPYGNVWRTGANEATTFTVNTDVLVEGQRLRAGSYALFTLPTEKQWTVIFNKIPMQFGAFWYDPAIDVLRVTVQPQPAEHQELLTFRFEDVTPTGATLSLHWEKLRLPLKIEPVP